jgi:ATP-binding cassette, subfamily C, bacterial CydCD
VGLLDDDPYLFASTLAENVRLARPDATDAEVADALRRARLGEWLDSLPDGLATRLGDGAASVSGGERARIGLARLLLADHPVLVLDEPTAHLDGPTARLVAADLLAERGRRSVVWVTHDGAGLDRCDAVLDTGTGRREKVGV